jgi:Holliday junction resolvasome RuvABC DNA-binding subunit
MKTLISIQDKQVTAELRAISKHGKNGKARSVIFAARTRAVKAIMELGFTFQQAREAAKDAADMVILQLEAQ